MGTRSVTSRDHRDSISSLYSISKFLEINCSKFAFSILTNVCGYDRSLNDHRRKEMNWIRCRIFNYLRMGGVEHEKTCSLKAPIQAIRVTPEKEDASTHVYDLTLLGLPHPSICLASELSESKSSVGIC